MQPGNYPVWYWIEALRRHYFLIAKCGSQTLRKMAKSAPVDEQEVDEARSFAVVRDPLSRVVSAYRNKLCFTHWPVKIKHATSTRVPSDEDFDATVRQVWGTPDADLDRHLASQAYLLSRTKKVGHIVRLETLPFPRSNAAPDIAVNVSPSTRAFLLDRFADDLRIYNAAVSWEDLCD